MGGRDWRSTASEPDPEAGGGMGEAEGRVPPGLPIFRAHRIGVLFKCKNGVCRAESELQIIDDYVTF